MKREMKNNTWFLIALGSLAVSILSLFTSIISYKLPGTSTVHHYSIIDLFQGSRFVDEVLRGYEGRVLWRIDAGAVRALAFLALAALILSLTGICTMRAQRPRTWQFVMAVAGLAGTAIPSFLVLFAVLQSRRGFRGDLRCGIAPLIMPAAAVISIVAVTWRRNRALQEMERQARAQHLIWEAGDLGGGMRPGDGHAPGGQGYDRGMAGGQGAAGRHPAQPGYGYGGQGRLNTSAAGQGRLNGSYPDVQGQTGSRAQ